MGGEDIQFIWQMHHSFAAVWGNNERKQTLSEAEQGDKGQPNSWAAGDSGMLRACLLLSRCVMGSMNHVAPDSMGRVYARPLLFGGSPVTNDTVKHLVLGLNHCLRKPLGWKEFSIPQKNLWLWASKGAETS